MSTEKKGGREKRSWKVMVERELRKEKGNENGGKKLEGIA
jgi:hypothetical protein